MNGRPPVTLRFGDFEFNCLSGELRRRGLRVRLTPQARTLLRSLLSMPIRAHSREEIHEELWPGRPFMNLDHALNKVIHSVREALGDTGPNSRFIETLPRIGYRFYPEWLQPGTAPDTRNCDAVYSIAVLPLSSGGPNPNPKLDFLGSRIAAALTNALTGIQGLRVLAQGTVKSRFVFGASPHILGESLGVRAVLCGELILHDNSLFVREELIDVSDGAQISSGQAERDFKAGEYSEKELAEEILCQLRPMILSLLQSILSADQAVRAS